MRQDPTPLVRMRSCHNCVALHLSHFVLLHHGIFPIPYLVPSLPRRGLQDADALYGTALKQAFSKTPGRPTKLVLGPPIAKR